MEAFGLAAKMGATIATTGAVSAHADQSGGFPTEAMRIMTEQGS
jgi:hypothetical protein